jgi:hypothetical protein
MAEAIIFAHRHNYNLRGDYSQKGSAGGGLAAVVGLLSHEAQGDHKAELKPTSHTMNGLISVKIRPEKKRALRASPGRPTQIDRFFKD